MRKSGVATLAVLVTATAVAATSIGSAGTTRTAQQSKKCGFTLRIGNVLPFTGGLAAYGANMDRAVKAAIGLQNAGLKQVGLAKTIHVSLVGSEDGQTQATASVEARSEERR